MDCCHCTIAAAILIQKYTCIHITTDLHTEVYMYTHYNQSSYKSIHVYIHITTILYTEVYMCAHYNHSFPQECGSESDSDGIQSPPGISGQLGPKTPVSGFYKNMSLYCCLFVLMNILIYIYFLASLK